MGAIQNLTEAWENHNGLEVETFLKAQLMSTLANIGGKIGYVEMVGTDLKFYDEEGGTVIATIPLGGDVYTITIDSNVPQTFYVLADETTKVMEITPSTKVGSFGSQATEDFPEDYSYIVAVNTGNGYVNRLTGNIASGGTASFDIKPYIATGDNYIRVAVTGMTSGQTKTMVFTSTLTSLTMSCQHTWNTVWEQGQDYVINGIRFAGSMEKTLHVSINDVEQQPIVYSASQSYTTTATTYTIPSSAFPFDDASGVCSIKLWMTAQGVSTPIVPFNIICGVEDDSTPLVAINETQTAVNFTSGKIFSYVCYKADNIKVSMSATLGETTYPVVSNYAVIGRASGVKYDFDYSFEVDTGINNVQIGTLDIVVNPYYGETEGEEGTAQTTFDNTYSYLATPDALFYMNASTRSNSEATYDKVINEMGSSQDGNFAAQYDTVTEDISFFNDMWGVDNDGFRALVVPAGTTVQVTDFAPLGLIASYQQGITVEMMLKASNPSDYSEPMLTLSSSINDAVSGIVVYPTKIVVLGTNERSEVVQSVNFSENKITHITVTWVKNYGGIGGRNLVSIYINGISNVNFAFNGGSSFGTGELTIGQTYTDTYLYKMRVYGFALEAQAVFNNFLNAIFNNIEFNRNSLHEKNDILDGGVVDYNKTKAAGYNTMVVIMDDPSHDIPSFDNNASFSGCTLRFEYADDDTKNVTVENVDLDGQGTTSKKYYRWNLRAKTKSGTVWTYDDGTTESGKKGYFVKDGVHGKVDRITAKKNYASSMQGHKMGLTGFYNDIYHEIGLGSHLPNENYQVAVYQMPFVGFKYNAANDSYEYIGLYTAGPDKGSKVTFGYSANYTHLLSIEGPNHAPRGTRFLHPWVDVEYDYQNETLTYGGEEGWDCDYVGNDLSSDKAADAPAILALYDSEWKPAYEVVFNNSPYIVSASEMIAALNNPSITSIADLCNADNSITILAGSTNGYSNQLLSFYDTNYELYFYRTKDGRFEKLSDVDNTREHNVVTALYNGGYIATQSPTTAQIVAGRAARFKATAPNTWDIQQTLYHYCFCLLLGITDNFAKNSYPFKFEPLEGSTDTDYAARWGWREDDLDTALMTDNNGQNTKSYSVEHGDTHDGVDIFQGGNSALWVLIRDNYATETRTMMTSIANAASAIATRLSIQGSGLHGSLYNVIAYYCWQHSSKYFSATLYENDRAWSYIEPWLINPSQTYNGVYPLTQALGDQFQAESLWVMRRIAYIFSKFRIGVFTGDNTGWNTMAFTLNSPFTFNIKPAIDLYPVVTLANSQDVQGTRTQAGQSVALQLIADGQTTNYIKAVDWLEELGDLSGMVLTARGGGQITFSAIGNRLKKLKIGDEVASNVHFNADVFTVESPALIELDARNTTTLTGTVSLLACPRLRRVLFAGSTANGLELPIYGKVEEVSFPEACSTVFLHSLTLLTPSKFTLPDTSGIVNLYMNNCDFLNPFDTVNEILADENNTLAYLGLIFREPAVLQDLADLTNVIYHQWAGRYIYENGSTSVVNGEPYIEGTIDLSTVTMDTAAMEYMGIGGAMEVVEDNVVKMLASRYKTALYVIFDRANTNIAFADTNVKSICVNNWDTSGDGELTVKEASVVTSLPVATFRGNTTIQTFNEFKYWTGLTTITAGSSTSALGAFGGCTALTEIEIPEGVTTIGAYAFYNDAALVKMVLPSTLTTTGDYSCYGFATSNRHVYFNGTLRQWMNITFNNTNVDRGTNPAYGAHFYIDGEEVTNLVIPDGVTTIKAKAFFGMRYITSLSIPNTVTSINARALSNCYSLSSIIGGDSITSIEAHAFYYDTGLTQVPSFVKNLTSIGESAFAYCSNMEGDFLAPNATSFGATALLNTSKVKDVDIRNITSVYVRYIAGCSNGQYTLKIGNFGRSASDYKVANFKNILVYETKTETSTIAGIGFQVNSNLKTMRFRKNINTAYSYLAIVNGSGRQGLRFLEIMGTYGGNVLVDSVWGASSDCIHLGYTAVAGTPSPVKVSNSYVEKVYVGDGSSRSNDEAVLALYQADSNWTNYTSKLATWYDYNGEYKWYYVTDNLTNCTNTNPDEWPHITRGEEYRTTIQANEGYTLQSVQVQMYQCEDNGVTPDTPTDITSTVYDASTGEIYINSVMGNIIITAIAS